jgi:hypothetical protein
MAVGFVELLSTAGKVIATTWSQGSRLLWSVAGACAAAALVLSLGAHFEMAKAAGLWTEYGLVLIVAAAVFAVLAAFKSYAERPKIVLIADEQQSFWTHARQPEGTIYTQFALRFHVTNMNDGSLHLSKVRINWPWINRRRIVTCRS